MKKAKAIIIECPRDRENAQMFILNDDNSVLTEDSIPISKGYYKNILDPYNFAYAEVEFVATDRWDGVFETMDDWGKFNYIIEDIIIYKSDDKPVLDLMKEGIFWNDVKTLIELKEWEGNKFNNMVNEIHENLNNVKMMGININDTFEPWTDMILSGKKTIETRNTDSLRPYVGKRVGIVRTGKGKATLVGFATIGEPIKYDEETFHKDVKKHQVKQGSKFDIPNGGVKYGYPLSDVEKTEPKEVDTSGRIARNISHLIN